VDVSVLQAAKLAEQLLDVGDGHAEVEVRNHQLARSCGSEGCSASGRTGVSIMLPGVAHVPIVASNRFASTAASVCNLSASGCTAASVSDLSASGCTAASVSDLSASGGTAASKLIPASARASSARGDVHLALAPAGSGD